MLLGCGASLNEPLSSDLSIVEGEQAAGDSATAETDGVAKPDALTQVAGDRPPKPLKPFAKADIGPKPTKPAVSSAYTIGPLDVLEVSVFKVEELSKTVQVADTGTINLPLVGEVQAGGRTPRQVEQHLTKLLGEKYLQNPQISVFVKEYNSQKVSIQGAVKKPGVYPLQGKMTLLQLVAMADGLHDIYADSTVLVLRDVEGKRSAARFDVSSIREGRARDPELQSGDKVVAGESEIMKSFYNIIRFLPIGGAFALL